MEGTIALGVAFTAVALGIPMFFNKLKGQGHLKLPSLPSLKFSFIRRKGVEEKMKEIDEKLEEVVSSGVDKNVEKVVEESSEKVKVEEDLLEEMETASSLKSSEETENEEESKPEIPELPDLSVNSDLEIDTEDIDSEFKLGEEENEESGDDVEGVEFDEKDDLIESLAKEVAVEEEEEIDLLRDLKGQKFDVNELQSELVEVLERLKSIKKRS
ncbi:hypothetical protein [Archaeoglobus profundus]|uniref:Uncharacterized protein n=1 Tax=Archaeoglobus profundus (strain DSM 5631 / JCM 9629 / NBRC 100127 / Av18) TaxID=572546 RepID=D2RE87_ARCPA|nr:hypothetical protein [Archaeoglobus profundus]ADB58431.1 hypothetical protein Arcpr_1382 [Archaeoglobus profundus DSM 5631]